MAQTLSFTNAFLKQQYEGGISDVVNQRVPLYSRLKKTIKEFNSAAGIDLTYKFPMKTQVNQGVGNRAAGGVLPTAGQFKGQQASVAMKYGYGRCQFEGQAIAGGSVPSVAFGETLKMGLDDIEESIILDFERQIQGDGSGFLGQISGTGNNTVTFTVTNPDTRWLYPGMIIDAYTAKSSGSEVADSVTIADVNEETGKITTAAVATMNDGNYIFRNDASADPRNKDLIGLLGMVDDGTVLDTYQGITRTTAGNNFNKGRLVSGGAAALTQIMVWGAAQKSWTGLFAGAGDSTVGLNDPLSMTYIAKLLTANERFVDTKEFTTGWKTLRFQIGGKAIEFIEDQKAYPGYIYFLNEKSMEFSFAKGAHFEFMDRDNSILHYVPNYDAYEAIMFWYGNLACRLPYGNVRLYNYTAPS